MQKLFKNACLVDICSRDCKLCDLLIEDGKIFKVGTFENLDVETFDLRGNFVLPCFVNVFCDSQKAFEKTYGKSTKNIEDLQNLMFVKNALAGSICFDVSREKCWVIDDFLGSSEKELSEISDLVAKQKNKLFLKVGQDLEELGQVDKLFKKPMPQVLEDFGFLDRKPIIVGGNCFEKDDVQLFSQYDCDFCLTVGEDGKIGRRPTNLMMLRDLCVGIGSGYSFEIDFFGFMRQILMTQRGLFEDENVFSEQDVLKMATLNGSKILRGKENNLQVGDDADFVVIRKDLSLYDDVFKTLVWEKSKKDVILTVQNGNIVQKSGEIIIKKDFDYDIILTKIIQGVD